MKHNKNINFWLREGKQSKITNTVKNITAKFLGDDFVKVIQILKWMDKNLKHCDDDKKVIKIFATRSTEKILTNRFHTGCHDQALIFAVFCRAVGIPAKYIAGIDKVRPENTGHCVVEIYIHKKWVLVDQSREIISLDLQHNSFIRENFIVGVGLDSWDVGIKSFKTWQDKSNDIIKKYC